MVLLWAGVAEAQVPVVPNQPAFSVERLTPAPGPGGFWQVEDGDIAARRSVSFGFVSSLSWRPLVVRHVLTGATLSEPVRLRLGGELLAAYGLGGRWQLGLALPLVLFQDGDRLQHLDLPDEGASAPLAATTIGDVRVHAKMRMVEPLYGYGLAAGVDLVLTLPTGDDDEFAGEQGVVVEPRLVGSYRRPRWAAAVNLGPRLRAEEVQFLDPSMALGNELTWGAAGQVRVPPAAVGGTIIDGIAELAGAWADAGGPSPAEARLGFRVPTVGTWTVGAAAGVGFGGASAIGAPAWRVLVDVHHETAPRIDSDRDGIPDVKDRCPREVEDVDGVRDGDGCIDPDDDEDGVPDVDDLCADQAEDRDKFRDDDGCPDLDDDGDEIPDAHDRCPYDREDPDGHQDADGCPEPDDDGDGVLDPDDHCPRVAEDLDRHEDEDGCPDLDDDGDGRPDASDACPTEVEDVDGWLDADGCADPDDDRDGVPDSIDRCLDQPETMASLTDTDTDGCPDGVPLVRPAADGTLALTPEAKKALVWKKGDVNLSPAAAAVVDAIAGAAHRAAWDTAPGAALLVSVFDDKGAWSELAAQRSEQVVERLRLRGVTAEVVVAERGKGAQIVASPAALQAGPAVPVKQGATAP